MAEGGANISGELSEIRLDNIKKTRSLFTRQNVKAGDVIFEEVPLVSVQLPWNQLYSYLACHHCLRSLETALDMAKRLTGHSQLQLPHPECCPTNKAEHTSCERCKVLFCCEACKQKAMETYHRGVCISRSEPHHPLVELEEFWRGIHYPPETASIMLVARMASSVLQAPNSQEILDQLSTFCDRTINEEEHICHKLLGENFQDHIEVLRTQLQQCYPDDRLKPWFTVDGFRHLMALIGTNAQGIGSSSVAVWAKRVEGLNMPADELQAVTAFVDYLYEQMDKGLVLLSGQFLNVEGVGLYLTQSACNHSCLPNAEVTFPYNDHRLALVAKQDIGAGQEVFISYIQECLLHRGRHTRQMFLRQNYLFNCNCGKCQEQADDPDVSSEYSSNDDSDEAVDIDDDDDADPGDRGDHAGISGVAAESMDDKDEGVM